MRWFIVPVFALLMAAPVSAATFTVGPTDNLQAVITAAQCGDTITVSAGTYAGPLTRSGRCPGPAFLTIQAASCPHSGRPASNSTAGMPVVASSQSGDIFKVLMSTDYVRVVCLAFVNSAPLQDTGIRIGWGGPEQDTDAEIPTHIQFDRVVINNGATTQLVHAINANGNYVEVTRSWIDNVHADQDAQCLVSVNARGPILFDDSYCRATGENVLLGGARAYVPGAMPTDVTITNNLFEKDSGCITNSWTCKNLFEIKAGQSVTFRGNILRHSVVDGQIGQAILITPRGWADPGAWTHVKGVLIERNVITDVCNGLSVIGETDGESGDVTLKDSGDWVFQDNLIQINNAAVGNCAGSGGKFIQASLSPDHVTVQRNTIVSFGNPYYITYNGQAGGVRSNGFIFADNVMAYGSAPFLSDGGGGTIGLNFEFGTTWTWTGNCIGGPAVNGEPTGNGNVYLADAAAFKAMFVDWAGGNYRLAPGGACAGKGADFSKLPTLPSDVGTATVPPPVVPPPPVVTPPPVVVPPPPPPAPDPCALTPLKVSVISWPNAQTGNKWGQWNSGSFTLTAAGFKWAPVRFEATDSRGCSVTVPR